jgi:hypothetical protein
MLKYRILNGVFWLYVWLSGILLPVVAPQQRQLFRFDHFDDPYRLIGNVFVPGLLWFLIDLWLAGRSRKPDA